MARKRKAADDLAAASANPPQDIPVGSRWTHHCCFRGFGHGMTGGRKAARSGFWIRWLIPAASRMRRGWLGCLPSARGG